MRSITKTNKLEIISMPLHILVFLVMFTGWLVIITSSDGVGLEPMKWLLILVVAMSVVWSAALALGIICLWLAKRSNEKDTVLPEIALCSAIAWPVFVYISYLYFI